MEVWFLKLCVSRFHSVLMQALNLNPHKKVECQLCKLFFGPGPQPVKKSPTQCRSKTDKSVTHRLLKSNPIDLQVMKQSSNILNVPRLRGHI